MNNGWGYRKPLPHRRPHISISFEHEGKKYVGGYGLDDDGAIRELWLNMTKQNSSLDAVVCDAAIMASIALQHGASLAAMQSAMKRNPNGGASCPLGHLIDIIRKDFER